jgi:hypothetical protein
MQGADKSRLAREATKLDPAEEQAMAEGDFPGERTSQAVKKGLYYESLARKYLAHLFSQRFQKGRLPVTYKGQLLCR